MKLIKYLQKNFNRYDDSRPLEVMSVTENEFFVEIKVKNLVKPYVNELNICTNQMLKTLFSNQAIELENLDSLEMGTLIRVSKINLPTQMTILDVIEEFKQTPKNSWYLGMSEFGPEYFNLAKLTHVALFGSTGFGKSSIFKFLLSQTLRNMPEVVNFIVDPKNVDFQQYNTHPNVVKIATSTNEWNSLFFSLIVEIKMRQRIYSEAFTNSPNSLEQYNEYKKTYKRDELPHLPRIIVWIDEAATVFHENSYSDPSRVFGEYIFRKARAFGIHVICTSQRHSDLTSTIRNQCRQTYNLFGGSTGSGYYQDIPADFVKAIPGRVVIKDEETKSVKAIQFPFVDDEQALAMSFHKKSEKKIENYGLQRLKLSEEALKGFDLANYLMSGGKLEEYGEVEVKKGFDFSRKEEKSFCYHEFYEILAPKQEEQDVEIEDSKSLRERRKSINADELFNNVKTKTSSEQAPVLSAGGLLDEFEKLLG